MGKCRELIVVPLTRWDRGTCTWWEWCGGRCEGGIDGKWSRTTTHGEHVVRCGRAGCESDGASGSELGRICTPHRSSVLTPPHGDAMLRETRARVGLRSWV